MNITASLGPVKQLFLIGLTACLFLISACSIQPRVNQDFKPGTDFSPLHTFSIRQFTSDIESANADTIKELIQTGLSNRGYRLVSEQADFTIDINLLKQSNETHQSSIGIGFGLPIGNHGSVGLSTQKILGDRNDYSALLVVDFTDSKTNKILWRGNAQNFPLSYFFPRNNLQLKGIIDELLSQYPQAQ